MAPKTVKTIESAMTKVHPQIYMVIAQPLYEINGLVLSSFLSRSAAKAWQSTEQKDEGQVTTHSLMLWLISVRGVTTTVNCVVKKTYINFFPSGQN